MEIRDATKRAEEYDVMELDCVYPGSVVAMPDHRNPVDLLYVKVDKRKANQSEGICVTWSHGRSLLFNPKNGNMRAVDAKTRVRVYNARLEYWRCANSAEANTYRR
jgi:hypothetical protein